MYAFAGLLAQEDVEAAAGGLNTSLIAWLVLLIVVCGVLALLFHWAHENLLGRKREIRRAVAQAGYDYVDEDVLGASLLVFDAFGKDNHVEITNMVVAENAAGAVIHAFDYEVHPNVDETEDDLHIGRRIEQPLPPVHAHYGTVRSAALTRVDAYFPRMVIENRNRSIDYRPLPIQNVDVYDPELLEHMTIRGQHEGFSQDFLSPNMVDFILDADENVEFELAGSWLLCHRPLAPGPQFADLPRLAAEFWSAVAPELLYRYPAGMDSKVLVHGSAGAEIEKPVSTPVPQLIEGQKALPAGDPSH